MFESKDSSSSIYDRSELDLVAYFSFMIDRMDRKTALERYRITFHKVKLHRLTQSCTLPRLKGSIGGSAAWIAS